MSPSRSPRRSTEAAVTSATIGPTRTRVRFPSGTTDDDGRADVVDGGVGREVSRERNLPRVDGEPDATRPGVDAPGGAAGVEYDLGQSVGAGGRGASEQRRAREARHERVGRSRDELGRGAALEDASVDDHADLVGERGGVFEIVGDEDRRQCELAEQLVELDPHGGLRVGVECRQGLVEEENARLERERTRQRYPLPLAARQVADVRVESGERSETVRGDRRRIRPGGRRSGRSRGRRDAGTARTPETGSRRRAAPAERRRRCPCRARRGRRARRRRGGAAAGPRRRAAPSSSRLRTVRRAPSWRRRRRSAGRRRRSCEGDG